MLPPPAMLSTLFLLAGAIGVPAAPASGSGQSSFRCRPGVWTLSSFNKSTTAGEYTVPATSTRYCLFDGTVEMDEYRSFGPAGQLIFAGLSFHAWSEDGRSMQTLWVMVGDSGYSVLRGRMVSDTLVVDGTGHDGQGAFREHSITTFGPDGDYVFDMDRLPEGQTEWIRSFTRITAARRSDTVPAHPDTLRTPFAAARNRVPAHPRGTIVLDGLAEVHTRVERRDGRTDRTIQFSSRYPAPDRWRTLTWRIGDDDVATTVPPGGSRPR